MQLQAEVERQRSVSSQHLGQLVQGRRLKGQTNQPTERRVVRGPWCVDTACGRCSPFLEIGERLADRLAVRGKGLGHEMSDFDHGGLRGAHYWGGHPRPPAPRKSYRFDLRVENPLETGKGPAASRFATEPSVAAWRERYGIPPKKNGDYAFLLHILASLKSIGKGAVILPHGVLFRGNTEADIRREIVKRGYIKGIIGLPANLFYGTGIPACIIVLDKENAAARRGIFMIDASKAFIKDGNKNRLRAQDIHKIVDAFARLAKIPRYSRMIPLSEIRDPKNDFNLNLPRYIDSTEPEDLQDIDGHLRGSIPIRDIDELERYWQIIPGVRTALFKKADRSGYCQLKVPVADVKPAIFGHAEFTAFNQSVTRLLAK